MDGTSIILSILTVGLFVVFGMRFRTIWRQRNTGTGTDVDLSKVGRRSVRGGANMKPGTINRVERLLRQEVENRKGETC